MLYIIGLGLGDADDITIKGAAAIQKSSKVFLEMYTAILGVDNDALVCLLCFPSWPLLASFSAQFRQKNMERNL
jgi:hypothetical protein